MTSNEKARQTAIVPLDGRPLDTAAPREPGRWKRLWALFSSGARDELKHAKILGERYLKAQVAMMELQAKKLAQEIAAAAAEADRKRQESVKTFCQNIDNGLPNLDPAMSTACKLAKVIEANPLILKQIDRITALGSDLQKERGAQIRVVINSHSVLLQDLSNCINRLLLLPAKDIPETDTDEAPSCSTAHDTEGKQHKDVPVPHPEPRPGGSKLASAYYNLGNALKDKGNLEGAVKQYREALCRDPNNALAYNNLGVVLAHMGDREGAMIHFREAHRIAPNNATIRKNLDLTIRKTG